MHSPGRGDVLARIVKLDYDVLGAPEEELLALPMDMIRAFGLDTDLNLDMAALGGFVSDVRDRYGANPYHNWRHGLGVAHVVFVALWRTRACAELMEPLDRLAAILAALCHDVDHPGVNNAYESAFLTERAVRYNDVSVLEQHHSATMFTLLKSGEVRGTDAEGKPLLSILRLPRADFARFRRVAIAGILATDMARHGELTEGARKMHAAGVAAMAAAATAATASATGIETGAATPGLYASLRTPRGAPRLPLARSDSRGGGGGGLAQQRTATPAGPHPLPDVSTKQLVELLVHAADLSNPVLPAFSAVQTWALKVCDEFMAQAATERAAGLPCAPHMEGLTSLPAIAKLQLGFIDYVCSPLWLALTSPESLMPELAEAAHNMARNRGAWKAISDGTAVAAAVGAVSGPGAPSSSVSSSTSAAASSSGVMTP